MANNCLILDRHQPHANHTPMQILQLLDYVGTYDHHWLHVSQTTLQILQLLDSIRKMEKDEEQNIGNSSNLSA